MLRKIVLGLSSLIFLSVLIGLWLLNSQTGLSATVDWLQKVEPALKIGSAKGKLASLIQLQKLSYQPESGTAFSIDSVQLAWQPQALLKGEIKVSQLHVQSVVVKPGQAETEEIGSAMPEIVLPIAVRFQDIQIKDVRMEQTDGGQQQVITNVATQLALKGSTLTVQAFDFSSDDAEVALTGSVDLISPYMLKARYNYQLKKMVQPPLKASGTIDGSVEQLSVKQTTSMPVKSDQQLQLRDVLGELQWQLQLNAGKVALETFLPEQPAQLANVELIANGTLGSVKAELSANVHYPDVADVQLGVKANSTDLQQWSLSANTQVSEQTSLTADMSFNLAGESPQFNVIANWTELQWPLHGAEPIIHSPTGQLNIEGTTDAYRVDLDTHIDWQQQAISLTARGSGDAHQFTLAAFKSELFEGVLLVDGDVNWQQETPAFTLNSDWKNLRMPESLLSQQIVSESGWLQVSGNAEQLQLLSSLAININDVDILTRVDAKGDITKGFEQLDLAVSNQDGELRYQGNLVWADQGQIVGTVQMKDFNPGFIASQWSGKLSGKTQLNFEHFLDADYQLILSQLNVTGKLRDRPVKASGEIYYVEQQLSVTDLAIASGNSKLNINGAVEGDKIAFDWLLKSPDLADLYPEFTGTLNGNGQLSGTLAKPQLQADVSGSKITAFENSIQAFTAQLAMSLAESGDMNANIVAAKIKTGQLTLDSVELNTTGKLSAHQLDIRANSKPMTIHLAADGRYQQGQWSGQLNQFTLQNEQAGEWQLTENAPIQITAEQQTIPRHCWQAQQGKFCVQAENYSKQKWMAAGEFTAVPLRLFDIVSQELEQLKGQLQGEFSLSSNQASDVIGQGKIELINGELQLNQLALHQERALPLSDTYIRYQLKDDATQIEFHSQPQLEGVSAIQAQMSSVDVKTLLHDVSLAPISGQVKMAISDLSSLAISHPAFSEMAGKLDLGLVIDGKFGQPKIAGDVKLDNGVLSLNDAGITLHQIKADVHGEWQQGLHFSYQAKSGEGTLTGSGKLNLLPDSWQLITQLKGEQLELMNLPEAYVIASPDLAIEVTPSLTVVSGKIIIPEAELEPTQFNSVVTPSEDVVLVNQTKVKPSGAATELNVTVILEEAVKLKAMGFQGRLTGKLKLTGNTQEVILGSGEIQIKDGTYLAYGQLLEVNDGKIRFSGPVDDPQLDIKAIRQGKDVVAGLHISGQVSTPQAVLFSEPEMGQDDVLSYILLGKPIKSASATDAALLASAATGMGIQNGAMIGDQIASTFGLDEFSVRGDSAENTALYVGKYLSPKLYLSYAMGVFDSVSTVELRYELSRLWTLKAESGTQSGVDLLYTHESN